MGLIEDIARAMCKLRHPPDFGWDTLTPVVRRDFLREAHVAVEQVREYVKHNPAFVAELDAALAVSEVAN
ncbi:MAG: hypothetical protein JOZ13_10035 [Alphaproteobacteria bacterium]|nr:hypothetical protein [Alphaproteobacteria bacterium]